MFAQDPDEVRREVDLAETQRDEVRRVVTALTGDKRQEAVSVP